MAAMSYARGHLIVYVDDHWEYADDSSRVAGNPRRCSRCDRPAGPGGEDACLGRIPGALAACCGHGVEPPYVARGAVL